MCNERERLHIIKLNVRENTVLLFYKLISWVLTLIKDDLLAFVRFIIYIIYL